MAVSIGVGGLVQAGQSLFVCVLPLQNGVNSSVADKSFAIGTFAEVSCQVASLL